jgi:hypothetical protein
VADHFLAERVDRDHERRARVGGHDRRLIAHAIRQKRHDGRPRLELSVIAVVDFTLVPWSVLLKG